MPTKGNRRRSARRSHASIDVDRTQNSPVVTADTKPQTPQQERYAQWKLDRQHRFYLVQRIELAQSGSPGWFGGKFTLDYMGSAEFEFGATHASLGRIRERGNFVKVAHKVTALEVTRTVWFIGNAGDMDAKLASFDQWFTGRYPNAKELTHFDELFTGKPFMDHWPLPTQTVAWWDLGADVLWTLDETIAEQLLFGLLNPASPRN